MHKTAAWLLALVYGTLVIYASLYPFSQWINTGVVPWAFLLAPLPRYWTGFDVTINVVGYIPLGGLLALTALRNGKNRHPVWVPVLCCGLLALCMEALQNYLPKRVASKEDMLLNTLGAWGGAGFTLLLEKLGAIGRWSQFRKRWFMPQARGGMVLLATWPLALLFPATVPFGLGQVLTRLQDAAFECLADTPLADWLHVPNELTQPLIPLVPLAEVICVMLGLLIPCLLGFCIIHSGLRRVFFVWVAVIAGLAVTTLSAALSWGPVHAWAWLDLPALLGVGLALVLATLLTLAPWRASAALALLALGVYLSLLNQAPQNPYFAETLQGWEQGKFIRFNGLAQWLGWLWPYATLVYVLALLSGRDVKT
jgi:VanZ family protein